MVNPIINMKTFIKSMIEEQIDSQRHIDLYKVTTVNPDLTVNITRLNMNTSFDNVEMLGLGLGNGKGQVNLPDENDLVLVAFIANSHTPIVLGTLFDVFTPEKDNKLDVLKDEYFVNNKIDGGFIWITNKNDIILKTPNGAKIKLKEDGSFKLFSKTNHGIEVDASGDVTIRGTTVNYTQNPGTW